MINIGTSSRCHVSCIDFGQFQKGTLKLKLFFSSPSISFSCDAVKAKHTKKSVCLYGTVKACTNLSSLFQVQVKNRLVAPCLLITVDNALLTARILLACVSVCACCDLYSAKNPGIWLRYSSCTKTFQSWHFLCQTP